MRSRGSDDRSIRVIRILTISIIFLLSFAFADCPVIDVQGSYLQGSNYVGAPNNASPVSGYACVLVNASNVLYDCNGYNITYDESWARRMPTA